MRKADGSVSIKTFALLMTLSEIGCTENIYFEINLRQMICIRERKFEKLNFSALRYDVSAFYIPHMKWWVNGCASVSYSFQHINSYLSCLHGAPTGNAFSG
jgi:hypothetical protein